MTKARCGHRDRLRNKFLSAGFGALHDYEQIELLLTFAIHRKDVKPIAKELLNTFKSLQGIIDAPIEELTKIKGMGNSSASLIKLIKDICSEYLSSNMRNETVKISTPQSVRDYARMKLGGLKIEAFLVIYLNNQNFIIDSEITSTGTVDRAVIYPRNIIKEALLKDAAALIIVHNHPSGVLNPSNQDITLTASLKSAAETVNIRLLDHLIVSENDSLSFIEKGLM